MTIDAFINHTVLACPMCMSGADDNTAIAANSAIGFLLIVLLGVLGSFLTFIFYLARKAKTAPID
ncbi:MAG: hypothetical protein HKN23_12855 [Verrucomicrobiales bacterium]|nr:hypothetical protein [Verrucomicrobiales bacterium]